MWAQGVEEPPWPIGPAARIPHADPSAHGNARANAAVAQVQRRAGEIMAIERARDAHGTSEASGAVQTDARFDPVGRLARTHENGMATAGSSARDVETVVHAVHEKYIRVTLLPEERPGALGDPRSRMGREVGRSAIGLGLHDSGDARLQPLALLVDEKAPEKLSGDDEGVACVPEARQASGMQ